jgi:hypothetical protein
MEDNTKVKKAVNDAQAYYDAQDKREWVEWAGKVLMPCLHMQIVMKQADTVEEMQQQDKREQQEQERAEKEAELDEKEAEYIKQMNTKEIDEDWFRELIGELDLERAMGESIAEGLATMQDEEIGESEREESTEEELAVGDKVVELSTISKGKRKVAPARAKAYVEVEGPVSSLTSHRQYVLIYVLTVRPMFHAEDEAEVYHQPVQAALQEVPDG